MKARGCGFALSTVAMAAYNWIAFYGGRPSSVDDVLEGVRRRWCAQVSRAELAEALEAMRSRGWVRVIAEVPEPIYDVRDPQRWVVVARDRSDDGERDGGWKDWRLMPPPRVSRTMAEVAP